MSHERSPASDMRLAIECLTLYLQPGAGRDEAMELLRWHLQDPDGAGPGALVWGFLFLSQRLAYAMAEEPNGTLKHATEKALETLRSWVAELL